MLSAMKPATAFFVFLVILAVMSAGVAVTARAERPSTQAGDFSTPKKALKSFDAVGVDPHVDRASLFYAADSEDEKKVAKALASVDLALAKLRKTVTNRWDRDAGDKMVHALRDVTADDIDAATEAIEGDKATISGKGFGQPLHMVKVDSAWKVSIADMADAPEKVERVTEMCEELVDAIDRTEDEIAANKYANPSLLERAIKRRVRQVLGDE
jgi:hypothetical protein